ncbi:PREDICTED: uncharacterized protein LOC104809858 isoform X1 [Tarenaya hassleriana]|uniref:uncharacterized protein LOC104809858 isoform X1 n=1 Tax=Tarenaya hassleriana TaxID=28532 RepID=UPI00053C689F|nr:PREDICTED: uncharacterized protein LOC104809858 isoform X1 [Tarenaya hassleriana]XP_010534251.1 PREDICTED: uncharacterized protein LOC104809858 isoform X1 [Tarenaya hassleriana]XP_010534252.1 PREDICTED: uncharacterized protein LOC104809858 isoform X1 [Tarenaya hassleriana]
MDNSNYIVACFWVRMPSKPVNKSSSMGVTCTGIRDLSRFQALFSSKDPCGKEKTIRIHAVGSPSGMGFMIRGRTYLKDNAKVELLQFVAFCFDKTFQYDQGSYTTFLSPPSYDIFPCFDELESCFDFCWLNFPLLAFQFFSEAFNAPSADSSFLMSLLCSCACKALWTSASFRSERSLVFSRDAIVASKRSDSLDFICCLSNSLNRGDTRK